MLFPIDYIATLFQSPICALHGLAVSAIQCKVVLFVLSQFAKEVNGAEHFSTTSQFHDTITKTNGNALSARRPEMTSPATRKAGVRGIWIKQ